MRWKIIKKFKKIIFIIFSIFLICSIFFTPKKICSTKDDVRIDRIVYNIQFESGKDGYNRIEIENYNLDEIVACISKYKSHLTLSRATGYKLKNSEIELFLTVNGKGKHIVLGNINYEVSNYGKMRRNIFNANGLKKELKQLLKLDKLKGDIHYEEIY